MKKNAKRINTCLSLMIAASILGGCGTKEDKWNYSREDFPLFIKYKGLLKHLDGNKYSYSISLGKGRVKESVKVDDLILFNTTDATKKMYELGKDYLDYETLSSSSIKIENFNVENNSKINFNISHSGEYAIAVLDDTEIGVDIQLMSEKNLKLADKVLLPEEKMWMESSDSVEKFHKLCS